MGTMTGKGRSIADMVERSKVDVLCVQQETRWEGSEARVGLLGCGTSYATMELT